MMAKSNIQIRPDALVESINALAQPAKTRLKQGFSELGRRPQYEYDALMKFAVDSMLHPKYGFDAKSVASTLEIDETTVRSLVSAIGFLASTVCLGGATVEVFAAAARTSGLVSEADYTGFSQFMKYFDQKADDTKSALQSVELARQGLPLLYTLESAVDVRFGFHDGHTKKLPMALVYVDTNALNKDLHFQMTRAQVVRAIADFQSLLEKLDNVTSSLDAPPGDKVIK